MNLFEQQALTMQNAREFPNVPQIMSAARDKAKKLARADSLDEVTRFINEASLQECKLIIDDLIDRVSTLVGVAPELEDAACAINREIMADEAKP